MRIYSSETSQRVGKKVELAGWVDARRDHGKLSFVYLRDRAGLVQLVFNAKDEKLWKIAETLRPEWVIRVEGEVAERPKGMVNPNLDTGRIGVAVRKMEVLAERQTPPLA